MPKINQRESNGNNLPRSDHKRYNMLLELLDHPVHEYLSNKGQHCQSYQMECKLRVGPAELQRVCEMADDDWVDEAEQERPFV